MKKYSIIIFLVFTIVGLEYLALNFAPHYSVLLKLQARGIIHSSQEISPKPGRIVSLWMGWIGLGLMIIMNLYSMRKRFKFLQGMGKLSDWLNFHVFCGLLGPAFILFHSNLKVRGIVSISFWSMVISFSSGIIGRYFYVQLSKNQHNFQSESEKREEQLQKILETTKIKTTPEEINKYKHMALIFVGLPNGATAALNPLLALAYAIVGDIHLFFKMPDRARSWPESTEHILAQYAVNKRRALFLVPFQKLMGYWHTFHFPFAIFMYVVAIIHVATALILGV